jgi:hypothetical protein
VRRGGRSGCEGPSRAEGTSWVPCSQMGSAGSAGAARIGHIRPAGLPTAQGRAPACTWRVAASGRSSPGATPIESIAPSGAHPSSVLPPARVRRRPTTARPRRNTLASWFTRARRGSDRGGAPTRPRGRTRRRRGPAGRSSGPRPWPINPYMSPCPSPHVRYAQSGVTRTPAAWSTGRGARRSEWSTRGDRGCTARVAPATWAGSPTRSGARNVDAASGMLTLPRIAWAGAWASPRAHRRLRARRLDAW